ncbi:hypothetical protein [Rhodoflexus sp.]
MKPLLLAAVNIGLSALAGLIRDAKNPRVREFLISEKTQRTIGDVFQAYTNIVAEIDDDPNTRPTPLS